MIERLTDEESPTDADRLLVVTFTKAAAAEMRERIERRLLELIQEHPENARLRRQQLLLQQAQICTVDSFCSSIVREFFLPARHRAGFLRRVGQAAGGADG